ncbi:hypothetical protein FACS1894105_00910 [Clostridia bacterium]|nr:hypothetical protein FACS1894105_00910 [Clostridia bacterium]
MPLLLPHNQLFSCEYMRFHTREYCPCEQLFYIYDEVGKKVLIDSEPKEIIPQLTRTINKVTVALFIMLFVMVVTSVTLFNALRVSIK